MTQPALTRDDPAPEFKLQDDEGNARTLGSFTNEGPVMLVFYPGDFTPVCTKQLCSYQNQLEEFANLGVRVVGISADDAGKHRRFRQKYQLTFTLLSDPTREAFVAYGVNTLKLLQGRGRAVFIVSAHGRILYSQVEWVALTHRGPAELLRVIAGLQAEGKLAKV